MLFRLRTEWRAKFVVLYRHIKRRLCRLFFFAQTKKRFSAFYIFRIVNLCYNEKSTRRWKSEKRIYRTRTIGLLA